MALKKILMLLALMVLIVAPASAGNYTVTGLSGYYTSSKLYTFTSDSDVILDLTGNGTRMSNIEFRYPVDTVINFTIWYGQSNTANGYIDYRTVIPLAYSYVSLGLGTDTYSDQFIDMTQIGGRTTLNGYGRDDGLTPPVPGIILYDSAYTYGWNDEAVFLPVGNASTNLIRKIDIKANRPITTIITSVNLNELERAVEISEDDALKALIDAITGNVLSIVDFFNTFIYIVKILFIDYWYITIANVVMGGLAYASMTSTNVWQFLRKLFGVYRTFLEFAVRFVQAIVSVITNIISALKPFG